jgi:hypothetical protein
MVMKHYLEHDESTNTKLTLTVYNYSHSVSQLPQRMKKEKDKPQDTGMDKSGDIGTNKLVST